MKYYIYISDAKVDMLYSQIPQKLKSNLAAELKIDLKVLSASVKREKSEETRYSKLQIVIDYIEEHMAVGTVDSPKAYFRGTMPIKWGPYGSREPVVYFGGATKKTVLGLGGSLHHVIGRETGEQVHSHSATPYLLAVLNDELNLPPPTDMEIEGLSIEEMIPHALHATLIATRALKGPEQRVEFLAKRLLYLSKTTTDNCDWWRPNNEGVLLGTPIYVALAE
jgi:hypothetical protein